MELDRCANLLRLSLECFHQWEEPSLRSLRPPRLVQSVLANLECLQPSILAERTGHSLTTTRRGFGRVRDGGRKRKPRVLRGLWMAAGPIFKSELADTRLRRLQVECLAKNFHLL